MLSITEFTSGPGLLRNAKDNFLLYIYDHVITIRCCLGMYIFVCVCVCVCRCVCVRARAYMRARAHMLWPCVCCAHEYICSFTRTCTQVGLSVVFLSSLQQHVTLLRNTSPLPRSHTTRPNRLDTYIRISHNHIAHAGVNLTWGAYIV